MSKAKLTSENDYRQIDSYEAACRFLNQTPIDRESWKTAGVPEHLMHQQELETITKAINGGVIMDLYDEDVRRWFPWFWTNGSPSGFAFNAATYGYSDAGAGSGSRLSFLDEERAVYAGETFTELYRKTIE